MTSPPQKLPDWQDEKYIGWPPSHAKPSVRVPLPSGSTHSVSVTLRETEEETLAVCLRLRDKLGINLWGEQRWKQMLKVKSRSVAKHRKIKTTPFTGVCHLDRPKANSRAWVASWYELLPDGSRKKRQKTFSYGGKYSRYASSDQALAAAMERREKEERRWYSVYGEPGKRTINN